MTSQKILNDTIGCRSVASRVVVFARSWFCAAAATLIPALANGAYDLCIEDGGEAMCIGPEIGPWRYQVADPGNVTGDEKLSEADAIESYRLNRLAGGTCSVAVTDTTPPWIEAGTPEGQGGEHQGNVQDAQLLQGIYHGRGWALSTETIQAKMPMRLDLTGFTNDNCATTWAFGGSIERRRNVWCPGNRDSLPGGDRWQVNMISPPFQGYCYKVPSTAPEPAKNLGNQCTVLGNPVNVASGNKIAVEIDYPARYSSSLKFVRTYNSGLWVDWLAPPPGHNRASRLGPNWRSNFDAWIVLSGGGRFTTAYVNRPDGRTLYFKLVEGEFRAEADIADRLERLTDGGGQLVGWLYTVARTDEVETYDSSGRLISITDRAGKELSLQYDANDRLASVTDDFGKSLTLAYDASNRLATLTDPAGSTYSYTYNADGNVLSVTRPASNALTYVYGEQANPYALTGIVDENNVRFATYRYNVDGRVSSTEHAGGVEKYSFSYAKAAGAYTNTSTTVVDPLFQSRAYTFATIQGVSRAVEMSQPCSSGCMGSGAATLTYDANANVASRGDFKGNKICHAHDLARNLETVLLEGVAAAASCPADLVSYTPALGTNERKIITTWHPTYRLPTQVDEPGRRTTFTHDAHGNALTKTILDTATSESRVWTYTYNSLGQVLTVDGPRLASDAVDRTTYTYYTCVTGNKCGQVHTVTNALGQTTTYLTYNAHGQPLTITDPNGVQTTLVYDLRRRLTSRTVGTEQIGLEYWPTGLLKKVTLPDSSFALYTYDDAHRLTRIDDAEGNHVVYTLDSMWS